MEPPDTVSPSDMARLAENRARFYHFLSQLYITPPDNYAARTLLNEGLLSELTSLCLSGELPEMMKRGFEHMNAFLTELRKDPRKLVEMSVEFTRLLRGIRRHGSPPPPYESVYRDGGTIFGESTVQVQREYRRHGLGLGEKHKGEPPDHISFELDFMHHLCGREATAWAKDNLGEASELLKAEKNFLNQHLISWVGEFRREVERYDAMGFYRGLAGVTEGWAQFDHEQIDIYKAIAEALAAAVNHASRETVGRKP